MPNIAPGVIFPLASLKVYVQTEVPSALSSTRNDDPRARCASLWLLRPTLSCLTPPSSKSFPIVDLAQPASSALISMTPHNLSHGPSLPFLFVCNLELPRPMNAYLSSWICHKTSQVGANRSRSCDGLSIEVPPPASLTGETPGSTRSPAPASLTHPETRAGRPRTRAAFRRAANAPRRECWRTGRRGTAP